MSKPSKRVVGMAIRILALATRRDLGLYEAAAKLYGETYYFRAGPTDAHRLAVNARVFIDGDGEWSPYRDECAAAENLLRIGWLP